MLKCLPACVDGCHSDDSDGCGSYVSGSSCQMDARKLGAARSRYSSDTLSDGSSTATTQLDTNSSCSSVCCGDLVTDTPMCLHQYLQQPVVVADQAPASCQLSVEPWQRIAAHPSHAVASLEVLKKAHELLHTRWAGERLLCEQYRSVAISNAAAAARHQQHAQQLQQQLGATEAELAAERGQAQQQQAAAEASAAAVQRLSCENQHLNQQHQQLKERLGAMLQQSRLDRAQLEQQTAVLGCRLQVADREVASLHQQLVVALRQQQALQQQVHELQQEQRSLQALCREVRQMDDGLHLSHANLQADLAALQQQQQQQQVEEVMQQAEALLTAAGQERDALLSRLQVAEVAINTLLAEMGAGEVVGVGPKEQWVGKGAQGDVNSVMLTLRRPGAAASDSASELVTVEAVVKNGHPDALMELPMNLLAVVRGAAAGVQLCARLLKVDLTGPSQHVQLYFERHTATLTDLLANPACYLPPGGVSPAQLDLKTKAHLVDQVCTAAANLHISGRVAHLDMKADNLLIGPGGAAGDIGVTPCDLGTTATEATLARMQRGGRCAVMGTDGHVSPNVARNSDGVQELAARLPHLVPAQLQRLMAAGPAQLDLAAAQANDCFSAGVTIVDILRANPRGCSASITSSWSWYVFSNPDTWPLPQADRERLEQDAMLLVSPWVLTTDSLLASVPHQAGMSPQVHHALGVLCQRLVEGLQQLGANGLQGVEAAARELKLQLQLQRTQPDGR